MIFNSQVGTAAVRPGSGKQNKTHSAPKTTGNMLLLAAILRMNISLNLCLNNLRESIKVLILTGQDAFCSALLL